MSTPSHNDDPAANLFDRLKRRTGYQRDLHLVVLLGSIPAAILAATLILATGHALIVLAWLAVGVIYLGNDARLTVMATYDRHFFLAGVVLLLWPLIAWAMRTGRW